MNPAVTQWGPVAIIVAGYLFGLYFQGRQIEGINKRIDDLRDSMNRRFDDMRDLVKSEVKRIEERIDRLEHPIIR
jgi:archaellum component FlaC